jgi:cytochrome P450
MLPFLEREWRRHGDVFAFELDGPTTVIAHPEGIQRVLLTNAQNYVKGRAYDGVRRVIGNGVLALEGGAWKSRRTLLQPVFHRSSLARLCEVMTDRGRAYFDALPAGREGSFEIDAHREMVGLTLDVVMAALFGQEEAPDVSYEAMGAALELVSERANGILLPAWVPTPSNRKFNRTMHEVEGAIYRVIAAGRRGPPGQGTLLGMLLDSRDEETGAPLSDREVRDEVFTMFVAGHETTALTLTWMFTLLAGRPEILARMQAEVDAVLGDQDPSFEDIPKLTYLRQVIDETLRLRGPVGMVARNVVADDEVMGFRIPAGSTVLPFFYGAHRHPSFWDAPERFDPDRFTPERSRGRNIWSYLPFSQGKRRCIGDQFSLVETVVLVAQLLRRFDVEVDPSAATVPAAMVVTVRPEGAVRVRLRRRAANRPFSAEAPTAAAGQ